MKLFVQSHFRRSKSISSSQSSPDGKDNGSLSAGPEKRQKKRQVVFSAMKLGLQALKESSDALPPLKSATGGLLFLVDHHQTWLSNKEDVRLLAVRLDNLRKKMEKGIRIANEVGRGHVDELVQRISVVTTELETLQNEGHFKSYIAAGEEAAFISGLVEVVRDAITDYMIACQKHTLESVEKLITSDDMRILQTLPRAQRASHLSENHEECLKGTRTDVLNGISSWAEDHSTHRVYWLNGHAGSGKSTIAQSFSQREFAEGRLGASFFCSRDSVDRSDLHLIFSTIAFQLACHYPAIRAHVVNVLRTRPDIANGSLKTQLTELIVNPLKATDISTTIVIDALDECKDSEPASAILSLLARYIDSLPLVKFFITGRPEAPIRAGFRLPAMKPHTEIFRLHHIAQSSVDHDLQLFFRIRLSSIAENRSDLELPKAWPSELELKMLVSKAAGLFIFAATVVKFIAQVQFLDPRNRLKEIINLPSDTSREGRMGLDALYAHILDQCSLHNTLSRAEDYEQLRLVIGSVVNFFNPLSSSCIAVLLDMNTQGNILTTLRSLHSLVMVPESSDDPIYIYHKSFPDYLMDFNRCDNHEFFVDSSKYHARIARACFQLMKSQLRKNLCNLPRYAMNDTVPIEERRKRIGEPLEYACRFWASHVSAAGEDSLDLFVALQEFLREHQIHWFEVLSLVGDLRNAVYSLRKVKDWLHSILRKSSSTHFHSKTITECLDWLQDGQRFVLDFFDCIRESALHVYHSALPLSPKTSLLRTRHQNHSDNSEVRVLKGTENRSAIVRTIKADTVVISHVAFSNHGTLIAIIGAPNCLQLFDSVTGECLATLEFNPLTTPATNSALESVVKFSPDDSLLLSYHDHRITLWDVQTGDVVRSFEAALTVSDIAFSPDGFYMASCDNGGFVTVWETRSGLPLRNAQVSDLPIASLLWLSTEGSMLIQCINTTLLKWESINAKLPTTFFTPARPQYLINPMALSSDGSMMASFTILDEMFSDRPVPTITIYDTKTGSQLHAHAFDARFHASWGRHYLNLIVFSPLDPNDRLVKSILTHMPFVRLHFAAYSELWLSSITAVSPDENSIALAGRESEPTAGSIQIQESNRDGRTDETQQSDSSMISGICFSEGGELCAISMVSREVQIWNTVDFTMRNSFHLKFAGTELRPRSFSPNNVHIAFLGSAYHEDRDLVAPIQVWKSDGSSLVCSFGYRIEQKSRELVSDITFLDETTCILLGFEIAWPYPEGTLRMWRLTQEKVLWSKRSGVKGYWKRRVASNIAFFIDTVGSEVIMCYYPGVYEGTSKSKDEKNIWPNILPDDAMITSVDPTQARFEHLSFPPILEGNWVINTHGQRILWVPREFLRKPKEQRSEPQLWREKTLVMAGRNGQVIALDFEDVDIELPSRSQTIKQLGYSSLLIEGLQSAYDATLKK